MSENQVQREVLPGFVGPYRVMVVDKHYEVWDAEDARVTDSLPAFQAQSLTTILNSHAALLAYAKCEDATWGDDPEKSAKVWQEHGYDPEKYVNPAAWLDEMRRSAISLAEKGQP